MRYKEQTLNAIEKTDNLLKLIQAQINRGESRDTVLQTLERVKENLEEVRSLVNIEANEY